MKHPCKKVGELFRIELADNRESTVRFTQGAMSYRESREEIHHQFGEEPYENLPGHNDYVKGAVAGGLVDPENADEINAFLERRTYPDLTAGHNPVMIAYDTNLFGFRIPEISDIDPVRGSTDNQGRPPTTGYALSGGVKGTLLLFPTLRAYRRSTRSILSKWMRGLPDNVHNLWERVGHGVNAYQWCSHRRPPECYSS